MGVYTEGEGAVGSRTPEDVFVFVDCNAETEFEPLLEVFVSFEDLLYISVSYGRLAGRIRTMNIYSLLVNPRLEESSQTLLVIHVDTCTQRNSLRITVSLKPFKAYCTLKTVLFQTLLHDLALNRFSHFFNHFLVSKILHFLFLCLLIHEFLDKCCTSFNFLIT